jgi:hypothetical protein
MGRSGDVDHREPSSANRVPIPAFRLAATIWRSVNDLR